VFYIFVQGSYDCTFVGPFATQSAAEAWIMEHRAPQFDYHTQTETDMRENMREFGDCPIQAPA